MDEPTPERDLDAPYLPPAEPRLPVAEPSGDGTAPFLPPAVPAAPPTPAPPDPEPAEPPVSGADLATRNVPRRSAMRDTGLPPAAAPPPPVDFVPPELVPLRAAQISVIVGRGLFVVAALLIAFAADRTADTPANGDSFWPVAVAAGVMGVVGLATLVYWSFEFARNARLLHARTTTPASMAWSWLIPVGWVALSAVTYLRVDVDGDLDPMPGVAGVGLVVACSIPFGKLQRLFRGLSRRPAPVWLTLFPLDVVAFGLIWWRLTSWPDPATSGDADHVQLTANVLFGSAGLLVVGMAVMVWLTVRADASLYERLGRLEARSRPTDEEDPAWFATGLAAAEPPSPAVAAPAVGAAATPSSVSEPTEPARGRWPASVLAVSSFHVLWGLGMFASGTVLAQLAFDYADRSPFLAGELFLDADDEDRLALVLAVTVLAYLGSVVATAIWSVAAALAGRRVTVHAPNPGTFAILFTPVPVLLIAGVAIGGTAGYWMIIGGLFFAFVALQIVFRMLAALAARLGGSPSAFLRWARVVLIVYVVGLIGQQVVRYSVDGALGFAATTTVVQGGLVIVGALVGGRAMAELHHVTRTHRRVTRAPDRPGPSG